jgi:hypothetical protein
MIKDGTITKGARGMKKSKKVQDREMFEGANKRLKTEAQLKKEIEANNKKGIAGIKINLVDDSISKIKSMEPIEAMKEANLVAGKKGRYANLDDNQVKKIMDDTQEHIFQDSSPLDDYATGGRVGLKGGGLTESDYLKVKDMLNHYKDYRKGGGTMSKKKFGIAFFRENNADGGVAGLLGERQNFAMGKRAFLKLMGGVGAGIAGLKSGLFGIGGKEATKKAVTETVKQSAGSGTPPPYFFKLVEKIKTMGDDVTPKYATKDREVVKQYKDFELTEDVATGEQTIQRKKPSDFEYYDEQLYEDVYMNYKPGKGQADEAAPKVADEYTEDTSYIRTSGPSKGDVYDTVDGVPDDVIQEGTMFEDNMTEFGKTKKADGGRIGFAGGIARMLGE